MPSPPDSVPTHPGNEPYLPSTDAAKLLHWEHRQVVASIKNEDLRGWYRPGQRKRWFVFLQQANPELTHALTQNKPTPGKADAALRDTLKAATARIKALEADARANATAMKTLQAECERLHGVDAENTALKTRLVSVEESCRRSEAANANLRAAGKKQRTATRRALQAAQEGLDVSDELHEALENQSDALSQWLTPGHIDDTLLR